MRWLATMAILLLVLTPDLASANGTTVHIQLSKLAGGCAAGFGAGLSGLRGTVRSRSMAKRCYASNRSERITCQTKFDRLDFPP